jgi:hypothetical protein
MGRSSDYEVEKLDFRESAALLTDGRSVVRLRLAAQMLLIFNELCANGVPAPWSGNLPALGGSIRLDHE